MNPRQQLLLRTEYEKAFLHHLALGIRKSPTESDRERPPPSVCFILCSICFLERAQRAVYSGRRIATRGAQPYSSYSYYCRKERYRITRKKAHTPQITPPPYMNTPGDIWFVSFFDHHFITGCMLNTTPPRESLNMVQNSKISHRLVDTIHPQRAPVWTPASRQQKPCPITVVRTGLRPQPPPVPAVLLVAIYNGMVHETYYALPVVRVLPVYLVWWRISVKNNTILFVNYCCL